MTVPNNNKGLLKLWFRWKGSVWKDIYKSYFGFLVIFFIINAVYRFMMNEEQQDSFEDIVRYFKQWGRTIPLQFLIGFYVSNVFSRWWQQLNYVAWPDKFLVFVCAHMPGDDAESLLIRKTLARYANLLNVMVWKEIAVKVKRRFPTNEHLVRGGLMSPAELELLEGTTSDFGRWFVPVAWINNLLARCASEGRISDRAHQKLVEELYRFRGNSGMLTLFDWINIPLVYTQVVTIATYGYFAFCLIGRQSLLKGPDAEDADMIFPLFTTLEFIFYFGWMKVGEDLRCPFGKDDEDFDMNYILDRNIHVSNMLVDELHRQRPAPTTLIEGGPAPFLGVFSGLRPRLPHTEASWRMRDQPGPDWSLAGMNIEAKDAEEHVELQSDDDNVCQSRHNSGDFESMISARNPMSSQEEAEPIRRMLSGKQKLESELENLKV